MRCWNNLWVQALTKHSGFKSKYETVECIRGDIRKPHSADTADKSSCTVCRNEERDDLLKPPVDGNFFRFQNSYVEEFSSMKKDDSSQGVCSSLGNVLSDRGRNVRFFACHMKQFVHLEIS